MYRHCLRFLDGLPEVRKGVDGKGEEGGEGKGREGHAYHGDEFLSVSQT